MALPRSRLSRAREPIQTTANAMAMDRTAPWNPSTVRSRPPRKKPTPFNVFFEPVSSATHLKSEDSALSGTSCFTALLADILFRSFAIPESAWAAMTRGIESMGCGRASMPRAAICKPRPMFMVRFSPIRAPSQPPTRLVITPKSS